MPNRTLAFCLCRCRRPLQFGSQLAFLFLAQACHRQQLSIQRHRHAAAIGHESQQVVLPAGGLKRPSTVFLFAEAEADFVGFAIDFGLIYRVFTRIAGTQAGHGHQLPRLGFGAVDGGQNPAVARHTHQRDIKRSTNHQQPQPAKQQHTHAAVTHFFHRHIQRQARGIVGVGQRTGVNIAASTEKAKGFFTV